MFEGLKSVRVTFGARPACSKYYLTGVVDGLATAPAATVFATDGANDYSDKFSLSVEGGRLLLNNAAAGGTIIVVQ